MPVGCDDANAVATNFPKQLFRCSDRGISFVVGFEINAGSATGYGLANLVKKFHGVRESVGQQADGRLRTTVDGHRQIVGRLLNTNGRIWV